MKKKLLLGKLPFLALVFSLLLAFSAKAEFEPGANIDRYFWDTEEHYNINDNPDSEKALKNKYYPYLIAYYPDGSQVGSTGALYNYPGRYLKSDDGERAIIFILPYFLYRQENCAEKPFSDFNTFVFIKNFVDTPKGLTTGSVIFPTDPYPQILRTHTVGEGRMSPLMETDPKESLDDFLNSPRSIFAMNMPDFPSDRTQLDKVYPSAQPLYNVMLKMLFDEDDEDFENPRALVLVHADTAPYPSFIGTLSQTGEEFKSKDDNYGGWNTWTRFNFSENMFPLTYTFTAEEENYDFMFTASNPHKNALETRGKDSDPNDPNYLASWSYIHPSHLFWNVNGENDSYNPKTGNINEELYTTKGFLGDYDMFGAPRTYSIHLTGLEPGQVYQLKIDEPTMKAEYGNHSAILHGSGDEHCLTQLNAWVSLFKITDCALFAYQLVEHVGEKDEQGRQVYYTFDINNTGEYYRVVLDGDGDVIDCTPIDGTNDFTKQEFLFTDKIFIRAYSESLPEEADASIIGVKGNFIFENESNEENILFDTNKVFSMKGVEGPLESHDFNIEITGYVYNNTYEYPEDKLFGPLRAGYFNLGQDLADTYEDMQRDTNPKWQPTETTYKTRQSENAEINAENFSDDLFTASTWGQLWVPEPMFLTHEFTHQTVVREDENDIIPSKLLFYAEDLTDGKEYFDMDYSLRHNIPTHDFHVTFPYVIPNATPELLEIMSNGNEGKPYVDFMFGVGDNEDLLSAYNQGLPGFYNIHVGDVYGLGSLKDDTYDANDVRTVSLKSVNPYDYPIFPRNRSLKEMASVRMMLMAPMSAEYIDKNNKYETVRVLRQSPDESGKYEEAITVKGLKVMVSMDELYGDFKRYIINENQRNGESPLYLMEYTIDNAKGRRVLVSADELTDYYFDVAVSEPFDLEDYDENSPRIDIAKLQKQGNICPMTVRNVYLFPNDNEGLTMRVDQQKASPMRRADKLESDASVPSYHAITTPTIEPIIALSALEDNPLFSAIQDAVGSDQTLVRALPGVVEVLADDVTVFAADGRAVASGRGTHPIASGIYIARAAAAMQKVIIR